MSRIPERLKDQLGVDSFHSVPKSVDDPFMTAGDNSPFIATIRIGKNNRTELHAVIVDGRENGVVNIRDPYSMVGSSPTSYGLTQRDFEKLFAGQAVIIGKTKDPK